MPFDTKLTRALGIKVPIVQGGMQWVGYAELASAVSNAGGLGILTALTQPTPAALTAEIARCKTMTSRPFAVNLTLLPALVPPDYHGPSPLHPSPPPPPPPPPPIPHGTHIPDTAEHLAYAAAIIDSGIRIVETAGNSPGPVIQQFKEAGCVVIHKCTTIRHAQSAIKLGVDFLSIDGFECAGHVGESDITNFILLSRARQTLSVPFIASGGFADGQGLAAALALGAEGVNMGTRFMCTVEAPIHINVKEAIVRASEHDTELVLRRWKNTSRLFRNKVAVRAVEVERTSASGRFEEVAPLVSGKRGRQVFLTGDVEEGVWTAGQVVGLIHDVPTCEELVRRIEREAEEVVERVGGLVIGGGGGSGGGGVGGRKDGVVESDQNNPGAEIWGVGKSKL